MHTLLFHLLPEFPMNAKGTGCAYLPLICFDVIHVPTAGVQEN